MSISFEIEAVEAIFAPLQGDGAFDPVLYRREIVPSRRSIN
jgi:hypothetical protein